MTEPDWGDGTKSIPIFTLPDIAEYPAENFPNEHARQRAIETAHASERVHEQEWDRELVDIEGLDLGVVLKALFDAAHPVGLGFLHSNDGDTLPLEAAREVIDACHARGYLSVDYVLGVPIKLRCYTEPNPWDDEKPFTCDPAPYDMRQEKPGLFRRTIEGLRK